MKRSSTAPRFADATLPIVSVSSYPGSAGESGGYTARLLGGGAGSIRLGRKGLSVTDRMNTSVNESARNCFWIWCVGVGS